jgi:two-component system sensor histidine kinase KdpD
MGTAYAPVAASAPAGQVLKPGEPGGRVRISSAAAQIAAAAGIFFAVTWTAWYLHLALASVAFLYFLMIVLAAVRWGFWEATIASVAAVACLDYFFTAPLFSFRVNGAANLVALGAFEFAGLVVSRLSTQAQQQARIAMEERNNMARLYALSRSILVLDRREPPGPQIAASIQGALEIESVALFDPLLTRADEAGKPSEELREMARRVWMRHENEDHPETAVWCRVLMLGQKGIGSIAMRGNNLNGLVVDAAASIAAVSLERSRALEMETRAEAARQSDQLRTAVLDALAHAFKTPLTAIRAASSGLLEAGSLGPAETELVSLIDDESVHLTELSTRLLQTARLEGAALPVRREHRRLTEVIDKTLGSFPQNFAGHAMDVRVSSLDAFVYGNFDLIVTALTQLIDNAIKYSDAGSAITIRADATAEEVVFSVHNYGPAIRAEDRERVFERFYRSPGTEHRAPGTGLGLSVTKKVAEAHLGRAWVQSSAKDGTTFYLAIPRAARGKSE